MPKLTEQSISIINTHGSHNYEQQRLNFKRFNWSIGEKFTNALPGLRNKGHLSPWPPLSLLDALASCQQPGAIPQSHSPSTRSVSCPKAPALGFPSGEAALVLQSVCLDGQFP